MKEDKKDFGFRKKFFKVAAWISVYVLGAEILIMFAIYLFDVFVKGINITPAPVLNAEIRYTLLGLTGLGAGSYGAARGMQGSTEYDRPVPVPIISSTPTTGSMTPPPPTDT